MGAKVVMTIVAPGRKQRSYLCLLPELCSLNTGQEANRRQPQWNTNRSYNKTIVTPGPGEPPPTAVEHQPLLQQNSSHAGSWRTVANRSGTPTAPTTKQQSRRVLANRRQPQWNTNRSYNKTVVTPGPGEPSPTAVEKQLLLQHKITGVYIRDVDPDPGQ